VFFVVELSFSFVKQMSKCGVHQAAHLMVCRVHHTSLVDLRVAMPKAMSLTLLMGLTFFVTS
jgi:hypothetical protein